MVRQFQQRDLGVQWKELYDTRRDCQQDRRATEEPESGIAAVAAKQPPSTKFDRATDGVQPATVGTRARACCCKTQKRIEQMKRRREMNIPLSAMSRPALVQKCEDLTAELERVRGTLSDESGRVSSLRNKNSKLIRVQKSQGEDRPDQ